MNNRREALKAIQSNIDKHGHHIYVVAGGDTPRFAYTIGASRWLGFEVILAGAAFYSTTEMGLIINAVVEHARREGVTGRIDVRGFGSFQLSPVDVSWVERLMLGAIDFYETQSVKAMQILPDEEHWTLDVPDLSRPYDDKFDPAWRELPSSFASSIPATSKAITNLDALRGARVTEAARWEDDVWELFAGAGPDVDEDQVRTVPLRTLLAIDNSLEPVASLQVGEALWRDQAELVWNEWKASAN